MLKNIHLWLPSFLSRRVPSGFATPTHVFFCVVDHFEPLWQDASHTKGLERIRFWLSEYPRMAARFRDADGRSPQHTFFYPAEQYHPDFLEDLARLVSAGHGEVEIHLHHDRDSADNLAKTLETFKKQLRSHGYLSEDATGRVRYGFVHGNWALDNSRPDGQHCGVNNELQVLRDTGCYADFTFPSAPSNTQTRKINSIYYATDDPQRPKSHDTGEDVCVGGQEHGDLMIVQGPLSLNWRNRKWGVLPRIENGDLTGRWSGTPDRINNWVQQRIGVQGRDDWVFVKVHTHGCQEGNRGALIGDEAVQMHEALQREYNDGNRFLLHYVTAREAYNLIKACEAKANGSPNALRDYQLAPPPVARAGASRARDRS